jgi:hypothetical protein
LNFSLSLSRCLVEEGFSLGKLRKSSKTTTAVWQAEETWTPGGGLCHTMWVEPDFSAPRLFFLFFSLNANSLFQDLTRLREVQKQPVERKVCL